MVRGVEAPEVFEEQQDRGGDASVAGQYHGHRPRGRVARHRGREEEPRRSRCVGTQGTGQAVCSQGAGLHSEEVPTLAENFSSRRAERPIAGPSSISRSPDHALHRSGARGFNG